MSTHDRPGQSSFLPILEGKSNWDEWKQHLEVVLGAKHINLLEIITGVEKRPEDIVAAAVAIEAMIRPKEPLGSHSHEAAPQSSNPSLPCQAASSTSSPPDSEKPYQARWEARNKLALGYLTATIHERMSHHVVKGRTAHEVFESLREVCEDSSRLSPCLKSIRWTSYKYEPGQNAGDFLHKWRSYLAEMRASYLPGQQVPAIFCYHVFIGAVSNNPGCIPWLNTLCLDRRGFQEQELVAVYESFLTAESRRLGRDLVSHRAPVSAAPTRAFPLHDRRVPPERKIFPKKDEDDPWCAIHKCKGHWTNDCWSNPKNPFCRKPNTTFGANSFGSASGSKAQSLRPAVPNNEKEFHAYLSDDEASGNDPRESKRMSPVASM